MKTNQKIVVLIFASLAMMSCLKEEIPIQLEQGTVQINQVEMGPDYEHQIYFNLENNEIVSQNLRTDWDIAFEAKSGGWHVILNSSLGGKAANSGTSDFNDVVSLSGNEVWRVDDPTGNLDSTAIGNYTATNNVYIVDRGYNISGGAIGLKKIKIDYLSSSDSYQFRCASLDGTNDFTQLIEKDTNYNFIAFSLTTNGLVDIEPLKYNWDLLFTKYLEIFPGVGPYGLTGVLTNTFQLVEVATDTLLEFDSISLDIVEQFDFSNHMNAIGWDWKSYDFSSGGFSVDSEINFVIKNTNGMYYKLRFIDFYNDLGEKGAPKFELQKL